MFSSLDSETLEKYAQLAAEKVGADFAEGEAYDFTRCVRPDGFVLSLLGPSLGIIFTDRHNE